MPVGIVASAASALSASPIVINEVESNGDAFDWVELKNTGTSTVDVSGWLVKDSDNSHSLAIPAATTIAAGGYFAFNVDDNTVTGNFGLGAGDSARLFNGATLIDSYSWTAHAATTYGRSPDGTGAFTTTSAGTKGAANTFSTVTATPWPGGTTVSTVDNEATFTENLSGLDYEPSGTTAAGTLWAVVNGPGTLHKLVNTAGKWVPSAGDWAAGKAVHYTDGTGNADSEGVTFTDAGSAAGVYISTERNNDASGVSRPAILKVMPETSGTSLTATIDWNLTADLPTVGANLGLEAITWVPDSFLVAQGLWDESANALYNPATYVNHGTGLFFAGLEANGVIYAYALKNDGTYVRVATISSGFPSIMDLQFDADTNHLWAQCDNTCQNKTALLDIAQSGTTDGRFGVTAVYAAPAGLPTTMNNEGFAIAPNALCVNNAKPVLWADDGDTDEYSLRQGTINCPTLADAPAPAPTQTQSPSPSPSVTPAATVAVPTVSGVASVGKKLTAAVATVIPATATVSYQWLRGGVAISGATASTYTVAKADGGFALAVTATATAGGYTTASATSAATVVVPKVFTKTGKATITGAAKVGKKLKVKVSTFSPKPTLSYRWYANGKSIAKATKSTYTVTKSVKGKKLTVKVTAKRSGYATVVVTSKSTAKIKK